MEILEPFKWIFSGVGVSLSKWLLKRNVVYEKEISTTNVNITLKNNEEDNKLEIIKSEAERIAERFSKIHVLLNQGLNFEKFSVAKMAQTLGCEKVSELENIFLFKEEPTFNFTEKFSEIFGCNQSWLLEGTYAPFYNNGNSYNSPLEYYKHIEEIDPKNIYFIRCESSASEAFITLKISEHKYKTFHRNWHISNEVGATGTRQIYDFYLLIEKLRSNGYYHKCSGRTLSKEKFSKLYKGEVFPNEILWTGFGGDDYWWGDFSDVYHKFHMADKYLKIHGQNFLDAQKKVRYFLEDKKEPYINSLLQ